MQLRCTRVLFLGNYHSTICERERERESAVAVVTMIIIIIKRKNYLNFCFSRIRRQKQIPFFLFTNLCPPNPKSRKWREGKGREGKRPWAVVAEEEANPNSHLVGLSPSLSLSLYYLPTSLPFSLFLYYLPTSLPFLSLYYLPTSLPFSLSTTYLPTYLSPLLSLLPTYLPTSLSLLPTYLPTSPSLYYLPTYCSILMAHD
jgi:hypothetical protein